MGERSRDFDLSRGVDRWQPLRRLAWLALGLLIAFGCGMLFPEHLSVFAQRLLLDELDYPTRTKISTVEINERSVLPSVNAAAPLPVQIAEEAEVRFRISCSRHAPAAGTLVLTEQSGGATREITLARDRGNKASQKAREDIFTARLPALLGSLQYTIRLGDARIRPGTIRMNPLPQVDVDLEMQPPAYAAAGPNVPQAPHATTITAPAGSRIEVLAVSTRGKRLDEVTLHLHGTGQTKRSPLRPSDDSATRWRFAPSADHPLARLRQSFRFHVEATDTDGLQPSHVPRGEIRLAADSPPRVALASIHQMVLPTATPRVTCRVLDNYGIDKIRMQMRIERGAMGAQNLPVKAATPDIHWIEFDQLDYPLRGESLPFTDRRRLKLAPFELRKGDRIELRLEARDDRGEETGASVLSAPLYWEVSDRAGVLQAILEADRRTDRDLEEMIERQLGLGDRP